MIEYSDDKKWEKLQYLSRLHENAAASPFPPEIQQIMDTASKADRAADWWLKHMIWFAVFTPFAVFLGFVGTATYLSDAAKIAAAVPVAFVATELAQVTSYLATGTKPHIASKTANAAQNAFGELKREYTELGDFLVRAHFAGDARAAVIANAIRIDVLRERILANCFQGSDNLINPIADAVGFIRDGNRNFTTPLIRVVVEFEELKKRIGQ